MVAKEGEGIKGTARGLAGAVETKTSIEEVCLAAWQATSTMAATEIKLFNKWYVAFERKGLGFALRRWHLAALTVELAKMAIHGMSGHLVAGCGEGPFTRGIYT